MKSSQQNENDPDDGHDAGSGNGALNNRGSVAEKLYTGFYSHFNLHVFIKRLSVFVMLTTNLLIGFDFCKKKFLSFCKKISRFFLKLQ